MGSEHRDVIERGAEIRGAILELGAWWVARYAAEAVVPAMHGQWSYAAIEVALWVCGLPYPGWH